MELLSWFEDFMSREDSDAENMEKFDIKHITIDQSGSLGSLYDACRDTIMGKVAIDFKPQSNTIEELAQCTIHKGHTARAQNLLELVDVDHSLRLSILLKMVQPTGIASIINHPLPINKHTRFLYFYWQTLRESCRNGVFKIKTCDSLPILERSVTHIITEVVWGIHVMVILQLPPEQEVEIDRLLEQIRYNLINNEFYIDIKPKEKCLFDQIISTTVYSNIPELTKLTKLEDIWQRILCMKKFNNEHHRLKYTLSPIQLIYSGYDEYSVTNNQIHHSQSKELEHYLLQQLSEMKVVKIRLDDKLPELLQGKLEEQLNDLRQDFSKLEELYKNDILRIRELVSIMRSENWKIHSINQLMSSPEQTRIKDSIQRLTISLDKLTKKGSLIRCLQNDGFEYCNVVKLGIDQECNAQLVKDVLFEKNLNQVIFCSHDLLKERFPEEWNNLYSQMVEKHKENPSLTLVYADFMYTTFYLGNMVILSSKEQSIHRDKLNPKTSLHSTEIKVPPPPLPSNNEYINILLFGESGVGKSTFINAFANYLQFDTFEQAQSGKPIVVIPVSFLMTVNDEFDEQVIKFGEVDPNEDHTNSGQSVTQQCRSYVFRISNGKKLRIIDTPGFGDTRGDNQDALNMDVIFSFINNLTHLNGICLLFKPNVSQLNPVLYSCFTQLFQFFGENIRNHLIFCFTNARSTFFAPGDTRPLLKSFFESFPVKNIPFEKQNTFCFDSESFRYLVALQNSITFKDIEKIEFEKSWLRSVEESKRLRELLCKELHPYRKNIDWQSIKEAQCQINSMIRPMLEAIRNILRNILLYDSNSSIQLKATCVDRPTMICYKCDRTPKIFNQFWIFPDHIHTYTHKCTSNEQNSTEYRLDYECFNYPTNESKDILNQHRTLLCEICIEFARFLMTTQSKQDDPFLSGFTRMLNEEQSICRQQNQSHFNKQLTVELQTDYNKLFNEIQSNEKNETLSRIYELIMQVNEIPMVKEQINAIKTYQSFLLTSNEHDVTI